MEGLKKAQRETHLKGNIELVDGLEDEDGVNS